MGLVICMLNRSSCTLPEARSLVSDVEALFVVHDFADALVAILLVRCEMNLDRFRRNPQCRDGRHRHV